MCFNVLLCYNCSEELDSEQNINEDSESGIICQCDQRDLYIDKQLQKDLFKCSNCEVIPKIILKSPSYDWTGKI